MAAASPCSPSWATLTIPIASRACSPAARTSSRSTSPPGRWAMTAPIPPTSPTRPRSRTCSSAARSCACSPWASPRSWLAQASTTTRGLHPQGRLLDHGRLVRLGRRVRQHVRGRLQRRRQRRRPGPVRRHDPGHHLRLGCRQPLRPLHLQLQRVVALHRRRPEDDRCTCTWACCASARTPRTSPSPSSPSLATRCPGASSWTPAPRSPRCSPPPTTAARSPWPRSRAGSATTPTMA